MTIDRNFFVLAESLIIDERQRVSLINMYDIVWAEEFPYTHPLLKYIANLRITNSGESRYIVFELSIIGANKKELFHINANPAPIMPNTKQQNVGVVFDVQTLAFPKEGSYIAQLKNKGKVVAEHMLVIRRPLPEEA